MHDLFFKAKFCQDFVSKRKLSLKANKVSYFVAFFCYYELFSLYFASFRLELLTESLFYVAILVFDCRREISWDYSATQ